MATKYKNGKQGVDLVNYCYYLYKCVEKYIAMPRGQTGNAITFCSSGLRVNTQI